MSRSAACRDDDPAALIAHRARGYRLEDGVLRNSAATDMSFKLAAGGWITTAPDLVRFLDAVMDDRLVSAETLTRMLTPYVLPDHGGTVDGYGMGWFLDDYHGQRAGYHGGGTPQISAIAFFVPKAGIAVAGAFNLEEIPGRERLELAEDIADVVLGHKTPVRKHMGID
jgi:CubicO group peptidase (beta-lactamase class C family)